MKITRKFYSVLFFAIVLMMTSCNKDKKSESIGSKKGVDLNITDSRSIVEFSDKKAQEIYDLYLNIKAGLVNSNSKIVQEESKKLESILEQSQDNKQLKATSKLISLTKDIKKQRDFFVTLTDEIINAVGKAEIKAGEIYKQYCPMAFDGAGGYWLSDSKEIRNPYFGKKMLKCGEVKEIIE